MEQNKKIPLYAKIGWIVCWLTMVILTIMILKNCVGSVTYGTKSSPQDVKHYYQKGYDYGVTHSSDKTIRDVPDIENPLFKKSYIKGFRDGLDSHSAQKKTESE